MAPPRTVTLTLRARTIVAIGAFLLLLLLGGQLLFIVLQRGIVDDQRKIALRAEDRSAPVLDTARALLGSPKDALSAAQEAGDTLRDLRRVLRTALDEDLVGVTTRSLRRAPELLAAVAHAVDVLDRTYPTLRSSLDVQQRTLDILLRSLDVQTGTKDIAAQTRDIAAQTRDVAAETRDIARATLGHTESIDRKTGGTAPPIVP